MTHLQLSRFRGEIMECNIVILVYYALTINREIIQCLRTYVNVRKIISSIYIDFLLLTIKFMCDFRSIVVLDYIPTIYL